MADNRNVRGHHSWNGWRERKKMISRAPAEMAVVRENKVLRAYGPAEKGSYD